MQIRIVILVLVNALLNMTSHGQETLYIHTGANLQTHGGSNFSNFGSLYNKGTIGGSSNVNEGTFHLLGSIVQTISGDSIFQFDSLVIGNSANVYLSQEMRVSSHLNFSKGLFIVNRSDSNIHFVHFLDNSTHSGSNDSSHVDGSVRKSGNDAFEFPTGDSVNLQTISISAPASTTDHFTAYYLQGNSNNFGRNTSSIDSNCGGSPIVVDITEKEFWVLNRTNGSSPVQVRLAYDTYSNVNIPTEAMVACWNGTKWVSQGNGGNTGSSADGTVTTGDGCGSSGNATTVNMFGAFSFSGSSVSALPVEFVSFHVQKRNDTEAFIHWSTARELNNSHFNVQRSTDGLSFNTIAQVEGGGTTNHLTEYSFIDKHPIIGVNYYRIKQVDFDGKYDVTDVKVLEFGQGDAVNHIYPNPTNDIVHIELNERLLSNAPISIQLIDQTGKYVISKSIDTLDRQQSLDLSNLSNGVYVLLINQTPYRIIKK